MKSLQACCLLVLLPAVLAQDPPGPSPAPAPPPPVQGAGPGAAAIEELVRQLGSEDFKQRSEATEQLRALGEKARPALEKAKGSENLEQRTRATSLLEELAAAKAENGAPPRRGDPLRPVPPDGDLQIEIRPQEGPQVELPPFPRIEDFPDQMAWIEAVKRYAEAQRKAMLRAPGFRVFGPGAVGQSFSLSLDGTRGGVMTRSLLRDGEALEMTRGADGAIRLRIEQVDPKTGARSDAQSFEAPDLRSFQEQYPEVYEKYKDAGVFDDAPLTVRPGRNLPGGLEKEPKRGPKGLEPVVPDSGPAVLLGVTVGPVPDAVRAHVDVPRKAVIVESVTPGSLAERIGIKAWDVITHVDGAEVENAQDIRARLLAEPAPAEVSVRVLRRGAALDLKGPHPKVR